MPSRKEPEAGPSQDSVKDLIAELLASINAAATTSHVTINIGRFNVTVSSGSDSLNMGLARKAASGIAGTSSRNPSATSKASAKPASKPARNLSTYSLPITCLYPCAPPNCTMYEHHV